MVTMIMIMVMMMIVIVMMVMMMIVIVINEMIRFRKRLPYEENECINKREY
jgi:hypothetical protein